MENTFNNEFSSNCTCGDSKNYCNPKVNQDFNNNKIPKMVSFKFIFDNYADVRVVIVTDVNPKIALFYGADIANILGYNEFDSERNMYSMLNDNEYAPIHINHINNNHIISDIPNSPNFTFISLAGLQKLICASNYPKAEKFQNWIIDKVLASIDFYIEVLKGNHRKSFMADHMCSISLNDLYQCFNYNCTYIDQKKLIKLLIRDGFIYPTKAPSKKSLDMGLMDFKVWEMPNGCIFKYTYILPKGIEYFINKYSNYAK